MTHSAMWKKYMVRFLCRILTLAVAVLLYVLRPESFAVVQGLNFFRRFSLLHILWVIWMIDMISQLLPARKYIALGSLKYMARYHQPAQTPELSVTRAFVNSSDRGALKVLVVWVLLTLVIGALHVFQILNASILLLISVFFYLCDLICVLFWCPFRVFLMKNRCCTTCRIFNWDHFMMFSILVFVPGFYTLSLFFLSIVVLLVWEITFHTHPERFWDRTNRSLRCASCTDRLCAHTACIRKPKQMQ